MNATQFNDKQSPVPDFLTNLGRWILIVLEHEGPLSLAALVRELHAVSSNEVGLAVGWLAKENQVRVSQEYGFIRIAINRATKTKQKVGKQA